MDANVHFWIVMGVSFGLAVPTALIATLLVQIRDARGGGPIYEPNDAPPPRRAVAAIALDAPAIALDAPAAPVIRSLEAALRAIPGAVALPPQAGRGNAVLVATLDEDFVRTVRAAVRSVSGEDIHLVAGMAPPDPQFDPYRRGRYLWHECWRNGVLLGPEPRRQCDINALRSSWPYYWIVRPADSGHDDLALGLPGAPTMLPARRPSCVVRTPERPLPPGAPRAPYDDLAPRRGNWVDEW